MTAKRTPKWKYIVKLSAEERERLNALIQTGKHRARQVLKADASEDGEGWIGSRIAEALDTSTDTVARTPQQLVEGLDAALTRKHSPASARQRIFDGAAKAKHRPGLFRAAQRPRADLAGLVRGIQFDIDFFDPGADLFDLLTQQGEHLLGLRRNGGLLFNSR